MTANISEDSKFFKRLPSKEQPTQKKLIPGYFFLSTGF